MMRSTAATLAITVGLATAGVLLVGLTSNLPDPDVAAALEADAARPPTVRVETTDAEGARPTLTVHVFSDAGPLPADVAWTRLDIRDPVDNAVDVAADLNATRTATDAHGTVRFPVDPGQPWIVASADGHQTAHARLDLPRGADATVHIHLDDRHPWNLVAHRAGAAYAPENTLAALRKAVALDVPAVELDVRPTSDGHLVLLHDYTLDRTTNGTGPVTETTLADLAHLDAGTWFATDFAGEPVPTLADALENLAATQVVPILDLKAGGGYAAPVHDAIRVLDDAGLADRAVLQSNDGAAMAACVNDHRLDCILIGGDHADPAVSIREADRLRADAIWLPAHQIEPGITDLAHGYGLRVVTGPASAHWLAQGVDAVGTDYPADVLLQFTTNA